MVSDFVKAGARIAGVAAAALLVAGCQSAGPRSAAEYRADQAEASNMRLVGFMPL
jgi:hypothetical protein